MRAEFFVCGNSARFVFLPGNKRRVRIWETSNSPGYETLPTDTPEPNLPDFVVKELWLENSSAVETYTFDWNQTVTMRADLKNIGQADWAAYPGEPEADDIYVKFYLSNGYGMLIFVFTHDNAQRQ